MVRSNDWSSAWHTENMLLDVIHPLVSCLLEELSDNCSNMLPMVADCVLMAGPQFPQHNRFGFQNLSSQRVVIGCIFADVVGYYDVAHGLTGSGRSGDAVPAVPDTGDEPQNQQFLNFSCIRLCLNNYFKTLIRLYCRRPRRGLCWSASQGWAILPPGHWNARLIKLECQ